MAIAFNCPHCQLAYNLPDKLAGKQAKCKNTECRKVITIPTPITIPDDDAPAMDAAAAEAAALAALADEPPKQAEAPVEERVIPMTCDYCAHKWAEPLSKAGKNTLCPNPECRQRVKVPEPKDTTPSNWRDPKTKLPSLAKDQTPKLEGVQDAANVEVVKRVSLEQAGALAEEIEPRPLKQKIMFVLIGVGLVGALGYGGCYLSDRRTTGKEELLWAEARQKFDTEAPSMTPVEAGLSSAVLSVAEAEHILRKNDAKELGKAHELFTRALTEVRRQPPGPARNALATELAFAILDFGGTDEQVAEQLRYRWEPDTGRQARLNERVRTVYTELRAILEMIKPADFDFRLATARRLTRELAKRGHPALAADLLPLALFTAGQDDVEARAAIALELHRTVPGSDLPRKTANELKASLTGGVKGNPFPSSAVALFAIVGIEKPPQLLPPLAPTGNLSDPARQAYTTLRLLEGKPDEALGIAQRQGANAADSQLEALTLCADWWSGDAGVVFDAAKKVVDGARGKAPVALTQAHLLRLSQLAATSGKHDLSTAFADAMTDDGLKAWAKGDAVRWRIAANPKEKADPEWIKEPEDAKAQKVGHAWGRMWIARQNAKLSGSRDGEKKPVDLGWPAALKPFGYAGIALGLQDQQ